MKRFRRGNVDTVVLYATFAGTGIGLVLPGTLLPRLLERWMMSDSKAGLLLFVFSIGTILGALLSRGRPGLWAARGCLVTAFGLVTLASVTRGWVFFAMAVFGSGLGLVMTSVSMLEARRHAADRAAQLTRLNLAWAIGACCGPWLLLHGSAHAGLDITLYLVGAWFAGMAVAILGLVSHVPKTEVHGAVPQRGPVEIRVLLLMVLLATGVESAVGGWLATFTKRTGANLDGTIAATTCLWAGLLLSRAALSNRRIAAACSSILLWACPAVISSALALLLLSVSRSVMTAGAFLLGVGLGPMYPALLARVLRGNETKTAAFMLAGVGASTLPLLTGLVSGWSGSLRVGLCVPLVAAAAMLACGLAARSSTAENAGL